jgi:dihydrofolate reductase
MLSMPQLDDRLISEGHSWQLRQQNLDYNQHTIINLQRYTRMAQPGIENFLHIQNQIKNSIESTTMPPLPSLALILAATSRAMGIGRAGQLPWPMLKTEMAYFARVTQRTAPDEQQANCVNAVIMGRKTWESIPPKFRPLKDRINVVISRKPEALGFESSSQGLQAKTPVAVASLEDAVDLLAKNSTAQRSRVMAEGEGQEQISVSRIFVIGGAQIYAEALHFSSCNRILLSRVYTDFECDTRFPLDLKEEGSDGKAGVWKRASKQALNEWVGEEVPAGKLSEKGVEWEFEMWERKSSCPEKSHV